MSVDSAPSWLERNLPNMPTFLKIVGMGVGTAILARIIVIGVLGMVGFSAGGIVAGGCSWRRVLLYTCSCLPHLFLLQGSIAARWQATMGNVPGGSLFLTLRSLSAVGLNARAAVGIGGGAALAAALRTWREVRIINL